MTAPHDTSLADVAAHSPMLAEILQGIRANRSARPAPPSRATGPRTLRGKQASRANATTHGMRCQVVAPPDDLPKIEVRAAAWTADLRPEGAAQTWVVGRAAALSVRLDRCIGREQLALAENTAAAERRWLGKRRAWARRLGNRLVERPKKAFARLLSSAIGIDWLLARWEELATVLEHPMGYWGREERERAARLMGLSLQKTAAADPEFRPLWVNALATDLEAGAEELDWTLGRDTSHLEGEARLALARRPLPDGATARRDLLAIIRREQERLRALRAEAWESVDRPALEAACEHARTFDPGPEASLARRYESANALELARCLNLLSRLKREAARHADPDDPAPSFTLPEPTALVADPRAELPAAPPAAAAVADAPEASRAPNELQDGQDCDVILELEEICEDDPAAPPASQGHPAVVVEASGARLEGTSGASRARRRRDLKDARRRRRGRRPGRS